MYIITTVFNSVYVTITYVIMLITKCNILKNLILL